MLYKRYKIILLSVFLIGCCFACHKEPLKQPVSVGITVDMNRGADAHNDYHFQNGTILIQSIHLFGDRVAGEDVDYVRDFPGGLTLDISGQLNLTDLGFDLPQGDYDSLYLEIETTASANLKIEGKYVSPISAGDSISIIFEMDEPLLFAWKAATNNGSAISLNDSEDYRLRVQLDPIAWFSNINYEMLDLADFVYINSINTIPVNKHQNISIFSIVKKQIKDGNSVFVSKKMNTAAVTEANYLTE